MFKMKDLNYELDIIMGIKVKKYSGGFLLYQSHYIEKVLARFEYIKIKEVNTSFDSSIKLSENRGRVIVNIEYASAICSMVYAMHCTILDIVFTVCKLSKYSNPSVDHWKVIHRILGYLKRTIK